MNLLGWGMDSEAADEDLERADECYKLLLDADSDLTFSSPDEDPYWSGAYSQALMRGSFVSHSCSDLLSTK